VENHQGHTVLSGNLYNILQRSTELVILTIGMTFVVSAVRGPDISVGSVAAIAVAVFNYIGYSNDRTLPFFLLAILACIFVSILFFAFNGTLVAVFRIEPVVASLILFMSGRSIAQWIGGGSIPPNTDWIRYISYSFPGVPIQTSLITTVIFIIIVALVLKFTNFRFNLHAVGKSEKTARLRWVSPTYMKLFAFIFLGFCVALAGIISTSRQVGMSGSSSILPGVELDVILALAISGNSLRGGKFSISGSIIGAYVVMLLTETLFGFGVSTLGIQAYKAAFLVLFLLFDSPVVRKRLGFKDQVLEVDEPEDVVHKGSGGD